MANLLFYMVFNVSGSEFPVEGSSECGGRGRVYAMFISVELISLKAFISTLVL